MPDSATTAVLSVFKGATAKLERGEYLISSLEDEVGHLASREVILTASRQGPGHFEALVEGGSEALTRWGMIVGEIIYNLRCALDHIAYELVAIDTGSYFPRSQFPILLDEWRDKVSGTKLGEHAWCDDDGLVNDKTPRSVVDLLLMEGPANKTVEKLSPAHQAIIASVQPYRGVTGYWFNDSLGILGRLSNQDKHRSSVMAVMSPRNFKATLVMNEQFQNPSLLWGTGIATTEKGFSVSLLVDKEYAADDLTFSVEYTPALEIVGDVMWKEHIGAAEVFGTFRDVAQTIRYLLAALSQ